MGRFLKTSGSNAPLLCKRQISIASKERSYTHIHMCVCMRQLYPCQAWRCSNLFFNFHFLFVSLVHRGGVRGCRKQLQWSPYLGRSMYCALPLKERKKKAIQDKCYGGGAQLNNCV